MTDDNHTGRTFPPTLREDHILAGGMTLFQVDDEGRLVFEDRYRRRCIARGTDDVPVHVLDLMELLLERFRQQAW